METPPSFLGLAGAACGWGGAAMELRPQKQNQKARSEGGRGSSRVYCCFFLREKSTLALKIPNCLCWWEGQVSTGAAPVPLPVPAGNTPVQVPSKSRQRRAGALGAKLIRTGWLSQQAGASQHIQLEQCEPFQKQNLCPSGSIPSRS